ncbi:uncharacterized protein JOF53_000535 [Crossiella equi]|uniref:AAA+ ATPase domain-containing protein n=1 Tax=Crossiella equi TaxID=130796 RepID=A0ABS5A501_9PSEU|nr:TM0106 family RecB-like putative nuclease [Crossiella equi]MBP2471663.1 uncharacterized protein [Crossiella equi]
MLRTDHGLVHSPTDLVDLMECGHRSSLNQALALGLPGAPQPEKGTEALVAKHGLAHEQAVLARLKAQHGAGVVEIDTPAPTPTALAEAAELTRAALAAGAPVVYQGVFYDGEFSGRADFLIRTPDGAYEPHEAKLARHARPAAVLQLTAYADALVKAGFRAGPHLHLLLGDGSAHVLRFQEFQPLLTHLRERLRARLTTPAALPERLWDDEKPACATCRFARHCAEGRAASRDLSLVAGMRTDQRRKLTAAGITTIEALAAATETERPATLSEAAFTGLRAQATLQVQQDLTRTPEDPLGKVSYEIQSPGELAELPAPSPGDVFFDMEGDPFALDSDGLEYLFGAVTVTGDTEAFTPFWAHSRPQEKHAFEAFVDFVMARLAEHPDLHVYHYAPYEVNALKRLAALHGTREEEVDTLLRGGVLVDLYTVVRKGLRVSQRSYSIKYLEPLYMPESRSGDVQNAVGSIEAYEDYLTLTSVGETARAEEVLRGIADYNAYDCVSTHRLYRWLLEIRAEAGIEPVQPPEQDDLTALMARAEEEEAAQRRAERAAALAALVDPLLDGLPENPALFTPEHRARGLLAASVGYHRRETNPAWWEFFRQVKAPLTDLESDNTCAVPVSVATEGWVEPSGRVRNAKREVRLHCDPDRPHPFAPGDQVRLLYPGQLTRDAVVVTAGADGLTVQESAKPAEAAELSGTPAAVLPGSPVRPAPKDEAVADLARISGESLPVLPHQSGLDLLRRQPRLRGGGLPSPSEHGGDLVATVIAAVDRLDGSALAVQGPPGAGKTYLAGRLIAHLVAGGRSVGVTSNSHKAVENVLTAARGAARATGVALPMAKRPKKAPEPDCLWEQPKSNNDLARWREEQGGGHLVGGTAWTFANAALRAEPFDVLVIDEAGQFALADALAVSLCARNLVLLGDPQQLPQVVQGTHPAGADASALGHLIGEADVMPPELGYFLDQTRRMHPAVCAPISALSYAGLLHAHPSAADRGIAGVEPGLYLRSVDHRHNLASAPEEAAEIVAITRSLLGREWRDGAATRPLEQSDILVVAPYNLQVRVVRRALERAGFEDVRVGTVDKFQGQEAPVVLATMTSSSAVDLPRGLDFLLSRNRLNVALSRAQVLAVLVCSPRLVRADIRNVEQMRLVAGMLGLMADARPLTL